MVSTSVGFITKCIADAIIGFSFACYTLLSFVFLYIELFDIQYVAKTVEKLSYLCFKFFKGKWH